MFDEALFDRLWEEVFEAQEYGLLCEGNNSRNVAREACRRYLLAVAVEDFEKPEYGPCDCLFLIDGKHAPNCPSIQPRPAAEEGETG